MRLLRLRIGTQRLPKQGVTQDELLPALRTRICRPLMVRSAARACPGRYSARYERAVCDFASLDRLQLHHTGPLAVKMKLLQ
jgi:hypothetical protein